MKRAIRKAGDVFGRLTLLHPVAPHEYTDKNGRVRSHKRWRVLCSCGEVKEASLEHLVSGQIISCGCYGKEAVSKRRTTHGESRKPTGVYRVWAGLIQRCTNPRTKNWKRYGGRGISVCDEWRNNYETFREWALASGYAKGLQIDRIDNNGNYESSNCRFTSAKVNTRNREVCVMNEALVEEMRAQVRAGASITSVASANGLKYETARKAIKGETWAQ